MEKSGLVGWHFCLQWMVLLLGKWAKQCESNDATTVMRGHEKSRLSTWRKRLFSVVN
jgi:hypothetical protein